MSLPPSILGRRLSSYPATTESTIRYKAGYEGETTRVVGTAAAKLTKQTQLTGRQDVLDDLIQPELRAISNRIDPITDRAIEAHAQSAAEVIIEQKSQHMTGEIALQSFIDNVYVKTVNSYLSGLWLNRSSNVKLYWRLTGANTAAEPDLELVCVVTSSVAPSGGGWILNSYEGVIMWEKCLATMEVKTVKSLKERAFHAISQMIDRSGVTITARCSSVLLGRYARGLQRNEEELLKQISTEMDNRNVTVSILMTHQQACAFFRHSVSSVSQQICMSRVIETTAASSEEELYASPVGLILGVSIWAARMADLGELFNFGIIPSAYNVSKQQATGVASGSASMSANIRQEHRGQGSAFTHHYSGPSYYPGPSYNLQSFSDPLHTEQSQDQSSSHSNNPHLLFPDSSTLPRPPLTPSPPSTEGSLITTPQHPKRVDPLIRTDARTTDISPTSPLSSRSRQGAARSTKHAKAGPDTLLLMGWSRLKMIKYQHQLTVPSGSVTFRSRVDEAGTQSILSYESTLAVDSNCPQPRSYSIEINSHRGSGTLWDAFSAQVSSPGDGDKQLVVKLTNLSTFSEESTWEHLSATMAHENLLKETNVYNGALRGLQGVVVPRFYGLWRAESEEADDGNKGLWCALHEDAGYPLMSFAKFDKFTCNAIRQLYRRLHAAGVIHNDVEWRHILGVQPREIQPGIFACYDYDAIRLIDFDRGETKEDIFKCATDMNEEQKNSLWEMLCDREMREVEYMFSKPGPMMNLANE